MRLEASTAGEDSAADLRMPLLGLAAWIGGLLAVLPLLVGVLSVAVSGLALLVATRRSGHPGRAARSATHTLAAAALVAGAVLASAQLRHASVETSPVAALARERAAVELTAVVVSDPRPVQGKFADQVLVRVSVRTIVGRGVRHTVRTPLLVLGDDAWLAVALGATVHTQGRLAVADDSGLGGLLASAAPPSVLQTPDVWWRGAGAVRASIREAVAHRPPDQRALVPALVDGDDAGLDPGLEEDFRTTGLTHLTAVSGTNLTLVVGFLLVVARWCRVRGHGLTVVAGLGIVGFVLLARTEPSVLRAAAMGTVGVIAMGRNGRQRALRGLGVAAVVLLLVQPALAVSAGFALSVLATAGIVVLAPGWRDALNRWAPHWLAEAIAVPAAAQLACTPVVAALSGQVSLVAVFANLVVAPVVGPATVLGLAGGLVGLVWPAVATVPGTGASLCVGWIATVARAGADIPLAAIGWSKGALGLAALVALCLTFVALVALATQRPARRRSQRLSTLIVGTVVAVLVVALAFRLVQRGWPGDDWAIAMCDVGQGDALVLRAGPRSGVVVDVGPDPAAVDRCLDRLGVTEVPLLVLTHFHADHVDGLSGVLSGRRVSAVWTTNLLDPPDAVTATQSVLSEIGLTPTTPATGATQMGDVALQPLWPLDPSARPGPGDGSTANDASVVLIAEVRGVRVLLTGDLEPPGQAALARAHPSLEVDVLKVPHHGSRFQDLPWLSSLSPEVALVSAGSDNDYGHPAPSVIAALESAGADVERTDEDGDVLVEVGADGRLTTRQSR
ncbi:MAG: ComEC/Rec2 family competence protein [Nocardioides sp.]